MRAMVDILAQQLSDKTGTEFTVIRGRDENDQLRYGLKAKRNGQSYRFQAHRPMKLNDLTRWLTSICDMCNMGFIPVKKDEK